MVQIVSTEFVPDVRELGRLFVSDTNGWQWPEDQFSSLPIRQAIAARKKLQEQAAKKSSAFYKKRYRRRKARKTGRR
jgi:hypothetical protein